MASPFAKPALVVSLAVITILVGVITASRPSGGTISETQRLPRGDIAAAEPTQPSAVTSGRPAPAHRSAPGSRLRGHVRPAIPTKVTIDGPDGQPILSGSVDPLTASRNRQGGWAPIEPPTLSRAVWMTQSAPPALPSSGTTAIYGHACIGFSCVFNDASRARPGSTVAIETARGVLRYRVSAVVQYPKNGPRSLAWVRNIVNRLLLITCAYRPDHTSVNNLVIVADLIDGRTSTGH